jgi:hypothetical protein
MRRDNMKYMIFDKINKKYLPKNTRYYVSQDGDVIIEDRGGFATTINQDNYIVELSTGLLDKNGVTYCENDIVSLDNCKAIIKWDKQYVMFYFDVIDENDWCVDWNFQDDLDRFEIIGNIHDTPREGE